MKDIDFDELDRAVTSALHASGGASSVPTSDNTQSVSQNIETAPEETTSPQTPRVEAETAAPRSISSHNVHSRLMPSVVPAARTTLARKPVVAAPTTHQATQPTEQVQTPAPASEDKPKRTIPHREGRFMDVVRPGSKLTELPASPKPPLPVPPTQASLKTDPSPETLQPQQSYNTSLEAQINNLFVSEGHEPVVSDDPQKTEASQPMIVTPFEVTPQVDAPQEDDPTDAIAAELAQPVEPTRSESPFITDAKVEKRPLGGLELFETPAVEEASSEVEVSEPTPQVDVAPGEPVPEELASDLTAIESQETAPTEPAPISSVPENDESVAQTSAPQSQVAGPTFIARQYKEQPRTASEDDEAGAIFDPQTYQAPVEHPAKKSSGWMWVLACVLIIALATIAGIVAWMEGVLPVPL